MCCSIPLQKKTGVHFNGFNNRSGLGIVGGLVLPKRGRPHTALMQHQQNGGRFMHFARLEHIYLPNLGSDQTKLTSLNKGRYRIG